MSRLSALIVGVTLMLTFVACGTTTPGGLRNVTLVDVDGLEGRWTQAETMGSEIRRVAKFSRSGLGHYTSTVESSTGTTISDLVIIQDKDLIIVEAKQRYDSDREPGMLFGYGSVEIRNDELWITTIPAPFPLTWSLPGVTEQYGRDETGQVPSGRRLEALHDMLTEMRGLQESQPLRRVK